jgi:hypothetical protein
MMECVEPGLVSPEELLAFATGDATPRASAHVARCPACAAQAATYAATDHLLRERLFRADCPSPQALGELALGWLDPRAALAARQHLAVCPHCTGELALLEGDLRGDPMEDLRRQPGPLARLVARLLPTPGLGGAYAGVRGAADAAGASYGAAGLTLSLAIEADAGASRRWTLLLLVVDDQGGDPPAGVEVALLRDEQSVGTQAIDEWGNASFPGLERGAYTLELTLPERVIVVEGIEVGRDQ